MMWQAIFRTAIEELRPEKKGQNASRILTFQMTDSIGWNQGITKVTMLDPGPVAVHIRCFDIGFE